MFSYDDVINSIIYNDEINSIIYNDATRDVKEIKEFYHFHFRVD